MAHGFLLAAKQLQSQGAPDDDQPIQKVNWNAMGRHDVGAADGANTSRRHENGWFEDAAHTG